MKGFLSAKDAKEREENLMFFFVYFADKDFRNELR